MTLWMLIVIGSVVLILFGVLLDFISKKKGYKFRTDTGLKNSSESEILKQSHLNQAIGNVDSPNP